VVKPTNKKIDCYPSLDTYLLEGKNGKFSIVNNAGKKLYDGFVSYKGKFADGILAVFYGDLHKKQALVTSGGKEFYVYIGNDKYTENSIDVVPGTKIGIGAGAGTGLIDTLGHMISNFKWEWGCKKDVIYGFRNDGLYAISLDGNAKFLGNYNHISEDKELCEAGLIEVYNNDTAGVINRAGKVIVPCKFSVVNMNSYEFWVKGFGTRPEGLYSFEGKEVVPPVYQQVNNQYSYYLCITNDNQYGVYKRSMIIPPIYKRIEEIKDLGFKTYKDGKCGFIANDGTVLLNCEYDDFSALNHTVYMVVKDKKMGIYDTGSKISSDIKFKAISPVSKTLFAATLDSVYGIVNERGQWIVQPKFTKLNFTANEGIAYTGGKCGIIDTLGNWLCQPKYYSVSFKGNDYWAKDSIHSKYAPINLKGMPVSARRFDEIPEFGKNGQAKAKDDGKYGVIDTKYNYVLPPLYNDVLFLKNSYLVRKDNGWFHITDPANFLVLFPDFEDVSQWNDEFAIKKNGKWGHMAIDGTITHKPIFDRPFYFGSSKSSTAYLNGKEVSLSRDEIKGLKNDECYVIFWTDNYRVNNDRPIVITIYNSPALSRRTTYTISNNTKIIPDCSSEQAHRERLTYGEYKFTVTFNGSTSDMQPLKLGTESQCKILKIE